MDLALNAFTDHGQPAPNSFIEKASGRLAAVRNSLLVYDQDRSAADLDASVRSLQILAGDASAAGRSDLIDLISGCSAAVKSLISDAASNIAVARALDALARFEEALLRIPLGSDDFLDGVTEMVDNSFEFLRIDEKPRAVADEPIDFDIDEETLDIFRSEASELLSNIGANVTKLQANSNDREALWEVRRNSHTFKGAAGIVGLKGASTLAHRVEDLLDKIVETNAAVDAGIVSLLATAARRLEVVTLGTEFAEECGPIDLLYAAFEKAIEAISAGTNPETNTTTQSPSAAVAVPGLGEHKRHVPPIVRVSLDRLDDLITLTHTLAENRSMLEEGFAAFGTTEMPAHMLDILGPLLEAQAQLTDEIRRKLAGIRMVRFGTLETRLARAVHVTCEEENKEAVLKIENGDCEIDTQVIDALVEPLLHLLKNAVVHGIEDAETRRLIRKPEKGLVSVTVSSNDNGVIVRVRDDGRGLSAARLKQKAVDRSVISPEAAESMTAVEAFDLVFERGLTTAERLNLNAGRGIGMSIVKQSVETHGGRIRIASEPQIGTTFTIEMPLSTRRPKPVKAAERTPVAEPAKQALVLVVDDSASIRRQTVKLVEAAGHRALTAENGAEAIELLLSNVWRPDLILSDVEMPVMDGWEMLECIRSSEELAAIPVVMVTSLAAIEYVKKAFLLGATDYKVKPLTAPDAVDIIKSVLAKATASEPAVCSA